MKKFEFYKIGFKHIKEVIYVAVEELHYEYNFVLNGYCMFKNPKGEEFEKVIPFRQNIKDKDIKEMQIKQLKEDIKRTAIAEFKKKYGEEFDKKVNQPFYEYLNDINQFSPIGFEDSIYEDIVTTIISPEIRDRFLQMKGSHD